MSLNETRRHQIFPVLDAAQIETARRFASGSARSFAPGEVVYDVACLAAARRPSRRRLWVGKALDRRPLRRAQQQNLRAALPDFTFLDFRAATRTCSLCQPLATSWTTQRAESDVA